MKHKFAGWALNHNCLKCVYVHKSIDTGLWSCTANIELGDTPTSLCAYTCGVLRSEDSI